MDFQRFSQDDFERYLPSAVDHLGNEISRARDLPQEQGLKLARASFQSLFPEAKVNADDQHIGYLADGNTKIGLMHFGVRRDQGAPYIYLWDIEVFSEHRGKGYGKNAMLLLEREAQSMGINKINLNVFGHNSPARSLYEKLGYSATSITMSKIIGRP